VPSKRKTIPKDTQQLKALIEQATGLKADIYEKYAVALALIPIINYKLSKTLGDLKLKGVVEPGMEAYTKATVPANYWYEFIYNYGLNAIPGLSERFISKILVGGLDKEAVNQLQSYMLAPPANKPNILDNDALQGFMSTVFQNVIKMGFTIAPADLGSFVKERLFIQPEPEALGGHKAPTPNRDVINGSIDEALGNLNFTGDKAQHIKNRIWRSLNHATHTEESALLQEKIGAIRWAAEGKDVESPDFADFIATKRSELDTGLNLQLVSYLKNPELLKAKKESFLINLGKYRYLDYPSDNTLKVNDLELIVSGLDNMINTRVDNPIMADANLFQTKMIRNAYTDDDKNAALAYSD